jgi:hypothetical protein
MRQSVDARHAQFPAQQLRQQRVAQRGESARLYSVSFGLLEKWRTDSLKSSENPCVIGYSYSPRANDFGADGRVCSAVRHLA